MKTEHFSTEMKKVCAYIEKEFPKYFTEVNRINFFATFLNTPEGYGEIYNRGKKKWFVSG